MKKNLLFNLSNFRAVALCLAMVCSVFAGWATDTFDIDGLEYKITELLSTPRTCALVGYSCVSDDLTIPNSVNLVSSLNFEVTSIGESAFDNTVLASVTIPATMTSIGNNAFGCCTDLRQVTCLGTTPPVCDRNPFEGVNVKDCTLVVPEGCEATYGKADVWENFGKIVDPSGVENVTEDDNAVEVARYNVHGAKLSAPQKGLNIIKMSNGAVKKVVVTE